jgi:hypothetical protein
MITIKNLTTLILELEKSKDAEYRFIGNLMTVETSKVSDSYDRWVPLIINKLNSYYHSTEDVEIQGKIKYVLDKVTL